MKDGQFIISITRADNGEGLSITKRFAVNPKTNVSSMYKQVDRKFGLPGWLKGFALVYADPEGLYSIFSKKKLDINAMKLVM